MILLHSHLPGCCSLYVTYNFCQNLVIHKIKRKSFVENYCISKQDSGQVYVKEEVTFFLKLAQQIAVYDFAHGS